MVVVDMEFAERVEDSVTDAAAATLIGEKFYNPLARNPLLTQSLTRFAPWRQPVECSLESVKLRIGQPFPTRIALLPTVLVAG